MAREFAQRVDGHGARENHLEHFSVEIPKRRLTVFTGVSGSGRSSPIHGSVSGHDGGPIVFEGSPADLVAARAARRERAPSLRSRTGVRCGAPHARGEPTMRFRTGRTSGNVEDRRGMSRGVMVGGGLGTVVIALIAMFLGVDPSAVLQGGGAATAPTQQQPAGPPPADDAQARFVSQVLASTEDTWSAVFQQMGRTYQPAPLVLFDGMVQSACGTAQAAMGPFYCPRDAKVYIDLSFYDELQQRFNAPGDFAQAYVIAHEVGHHVQDLLGISDQVEREERAQGGGAGAGGLSVRLELQADCFAGVWGNRAQRSSIALDPGDIEEALGAASAIGDDRLQKQTQGRIVPDSFTHGTSAQRVRWFRRGFDSGDPEQCDTFSGAV